jgi:phosphoribosylformimino-5-aminoimidazole carboxamide ribotide isomerase
LGGGIRNKDCIRELLDAGLNRLVIGTMAVKNPQWFREMCRAFPGRLVLGIDARDDEFVTSDGWLETSRLEAIEFAKEFAAEPIAAIVYTDIGTDGMLAGPNLVAMTRMKKAVNVNVIASGGVTTAEDVGHLAEAGLAGCIIGRSLYEGILTLPDALAAAQRTPAV